MVESLNIYDESLEILAPYIKCFSSYIFLKMVCWLRKRSTEA